MPRLGLRSVVAGAALAWLVAPCGARSAQLDAFASVEAGPASGCTFAPVFLPGDPYSGVYAIPSDGHTFVECGFSADSGVTEDFEAAGLASASHTASDAKYSGGANASAAYGVLGASASGTSTRAGNVSGNTAGAFGVLDDVLTITSPSQADGASGSVVFDFAVDGTLAVENAAWDPGTAQLLGTAYAFAAVRVDGALANAFRANVTLFGSQPPSTIPANAPGFDATQTATGWSFGGIAAAKSLTKLPIHFGTPFAFTAGLVVEAHPLTASDGVPGTASAAFDGGLTLTGFEVFDAAQQPVAEFSVGAESGTHYVPEADAASDELIALAALAPCVAIARRGRNVHAGSRAPEPASAELG